MTLALFQRKWLHALCAVILGASFAACTESSSPNNTQPKTRNLSGGTTAADFGIVIVDSVAHKYVTFTNTGNDTLHLTAITAQNTATSGRFTAQDSAGRKLPIAIEPNAHFTLDAQFLASSSGAVDGAIDMTSSDPGASIPQVYLHATGATRTVATGSTYTYLTTDLDAQGRETDQHNTVHTVVTADTTYKGKDHCFEISHDTVRSFYHREANGDLSYYYPSSPNIDRLGEGWVTLTFGSKQTIVVTGDTEIVSTNGITCNGQANTTVEWVGQDTVAAAGKTLHVSHVRLTFLFNLMQIPFYGDRTVTTIQDFYFSDYLGTFAREGFQLQTTFPQDIVPTGGSTDVLVGYSIK